VQLTRARHARQLVAVIVIVVGITALTIWAVLPAASPSARSRGADDLPPTRSGAPAAVSPSPGIANEAFTYGFDLSYGEPTGSSITKGVAAARKVMSKFSGTLMDQAIYGFGADVDPEPAPDKFDMSDIARRLRLIESSGGTPVLTLAGAPPWMHPTSTDSLAPPTPSDDEDFATLCAHIARSFPKVKYFVVWDGLSGFWSSTLHTWNVGTYVALFNDVTTAIHAVRPTAVVGGPYVPVAASLHQQRGSAATVRGPFGFVAQGVLQTVSYWLAHEVGAGFIALDGTTADAATRTGALDAVTASGLYAAFDSWIAARTKLPIWWLGSQIEPAGWNPAQGAAARVATLAQMAASGARVGMQYQPQDKTGWSDEGLWTSTKLGGGGKATTLATDLLRALPILETRPALAAGEPTGVLVATDGAGTLAVNTTPAPAAAVVGGAPVTLPPGSVSVLGAVRPPTTRHHVRERP
jgi:hypothetical protein